jgi:hypothetical protein
VSLGDSRDADHRALQILRRGRPYTPRKLPGGVSRWGQGACRPRFSGDSFVTPPARYIWSKTYRAMQIGFQAKDIGAPPLITVNTGVKPGLTTVLTATRAAGARLLLTGTDNNGLKGCSECY